MRLDVRLCLGLPCSILVVCSVATISVQGAWAQTAALVDKSIKKKIQQRLAIYDMNSVVVFHQDGEFQKRVWVSQGRLKDNESLAQFLKTDPITTCKEPKPIPNPPPQCVVCKNGPIICSHATFGSNRLAGPR